MEPKNLDNLISPVLTIISAIIAIIAATADAAVKWTDAKKKLKEEQSTNRSVNRKAKIKLFWPITVSVFSIAVIFLAAISLYSYQRALLSDRLVTMAAGEITNKNFEDAKMLLSQAKEQDSANIRIPIEFARISMLRKDFSTAATQYEELVKKNPRYLIAYRKLATIYGTEADTAQDTAEKVRLYKQAIANIGKLLEFAPQSPSGFYELGINYLELWRASGAESTDKTASQAEDALKTCVKFQGEWSDWAYYNLAKLRFLQARINPKDQSSYIEQAFSYLNQALDVSDKARSDPSVGKVETYILGAAAHEKDFFDDFAPTQEDATFSHVIFEDRRFKQLKEKIEKKNARIAGSST